MSNNVRVKARIRLLPTSQSGRTTPLRGSYRPNHNFGAPDNREMDVGFIEFGEGELLNPGEATEREITFWSRPGLTDVITQGREWRIQEGGQLIGIGTILEIVETTA